MIKVGKKQTLLVDSEDASGYYLLCEEKKEVFMPGTLAPKGLNEGDEVEVFVFIDSKGDEIATGTMPIAEVGDYACLVVKAVTPIGAFLDIGLPKELLVPNNLKKYDMNVGDVHLVKVMQDPETKKLYGTEKIEEFIEREFINLRPKQIVTLLPFHKTPLGYKVLIENKFMGMVYHNEIFSDVEIGKPYEGTVKTIREDGQIDALLKKVGLGGLENSSEVILEALKKSGGKLELWDKSSPDDIKSALSMSKKSFKNAVGILYKKKVIRICEGYIELV